MEPTLLIIAWQCVREIALAVVASRRNRTADRAELRQEELSDLDQMMKVSVDLALSGPPRASRRVTGSLAPRRRRGACGGSSEWC